MDDTNTDLVDTLLTRGFQVIIDRINQVNPEYMVLFNYLRKRTIAMLKFRGRLNATPDNKILNKVLKRQNCRIY